MPHTEDNKQTALRAPPPIY